MKRYCLKVAIIGLLGISFAINSYGITRLPVDSWFESYGKIAWADERARLSGFAVFLKANPETNAYIAYNWATEKDHAEMKRRAARARKYLEMERQVDGCRIIVVEGGQREKSRTVLQPVNKDLPPPDFS